MIRIRRSDERGHFDHGWLDTYHTFSFASYYDPANTRFRALRVINEDRVAPGMGFGTHGHRDMEIITYVLSGQLEHRDSLGNGSVIRPGEFQKMTAGTGVEHSEMNPSPDEPVHLYQIWILPDRKGLPPSYEQRDFDGERGPGRLLRVASGHGHEGAIPLHQDAEIFLGDLAPDAPVVHLLGEGRHAWIQVMTGRVALNGSDLAAGDGAAVSDEPELRLTADAPATVMLFDLS